jgi:hypothetical protein
MSPWPDDDTPPEETPFPPPCDRYPDECGGTEPLCTWPNCVLDSLTPEERAYEGLLSRRYADDEDV